MTHEKRHRRKGTTVEEAIRQLADNREYQNMMADKRAVQDEWVKFWRKADRPIVADLAAVGIIVDSPWDLVNTSEPYPIALPVLVKHLQIGGYPDRVMEGLGRALAVKPASVFWMQLATLFRQAVGPEEQTGLGVALAASATKEHVLELAALVTDAALGSDRIFLVSVLARLGGDHGVVVLETLRDDPQIGREVTRVLNRRIKRRTQ